MLKDNVPLLRRGVGVRLHVEKISVIKTKINHKNNLFDFPYKIKRLITNPKIKTLRGKGGALL